MSDSVGAPADASYGMARVTAVVFAVQAVGLIALPYLGRTTAGAAACVIAFGLGFGVGTIARPAIVADRYGTARYATITGPAWRAPLFGPISRAVPTWPSRFPASRPGAILRGMGALPVSSFYIDQGPAPHP